MVFQRYSVFPHMKVRENIVAGGSLAQQVGVGSLGVSWPKHANVADETLARIGLDHVAENYPATLSGGMLQRLAIGQALTSKPRVLLLDEPFGALDPGTKLSMHDFLKDLREQTGMTVFMVTHDLEEAFQAGADRVLVFDKPVWGSGRSKTKYGATITYDFDARDGGIPYQRLQEETNVLQEH